MLKDDGMNSPREPGNIQRELDTLSENVAVLKKELEVLRVLFGMVLNPHPPLAKEPSDELPPGTSQLAETIGDINGRLVDCIHFLRDVNGECDL